MRGGCGCCCAISVLHARKLSPHDSFRWSPEKKTKIKKREATATHTTAQFWHGRHGTSCFPTPGMAQGADPAIPHDRDTCPHLTWPLPARPAEISSALRCSAPGQQPGCSAELGSPGMEAARAQGTALPGAHLRALRRAPGAAGAEPGPAHLALIHGEHSCHQLGKVE